MLAGLRVLDFTIWRPGPYCTQLLAELGAVVSKVEPPGGDPMRAFPALFDELNRRKESRELDLKSDAGRAAALELAATAEVVVESYRPGVADRLGVGWEAVRAVNPGVVYCSVSGMGQQGPLSAVPGHDLNYLAWSGVLAPEGGPPRLPAVPVADLAGGMAGALAVCAAVVGARATGEGARLDVSMGHVLATWTGESSAGIGGVPGYGVFEASDGGFVALGVLTEDHFWRPLCETLGLDEVAGLGFEERLARMDELQSLLAAAIAPGPRDEVVAVLVAAGVPAAPVLDRAGMLAHPHFRERPVVRFHR